MAARLESDAHPVTRERDWWLRALLVLQSPRSVFSALRDDSDEAAEARQEPVLALLFLAGIAGVLATNIAGTLLDDPEYDALVVALWAVVGGGIYGAALYFALGGLAYLGAFWAGGEGSFRRARHVVAYAAVPLVLSLLIWPVRLSVYGRHPLRTPGGSDTGAGNAAFEALEVGLLVWAVALLAIGTRTVHGWSWPARAGGHGPAGRPPRTSARARLRSDLAQPRRARAPRRQSSTCAASSGKVPARTSAAYASSARVISVARSAYCFTNRGAEPA